MPRRGAHLACALLHCTRRPSMLRTLELWFARAFAPVFAMLRDVPASALPRLFIPF